ncbi:hypothetical protein PR002_g6032 [Phytophthora rubi]|uniref:Uncharacterized protein n=1 Tax=Phytophthora rubi TaxID=129364 RepID=A0A6A3MZ11_9STRA|nr:hypothetical protein PR002_g6032 [Phytophthora rubi]
MNSILKSFITMSSADSKREQLVAIVVIWLRDRNCGGKCRTLHSPADKNTSVDATYHEVDEVNGLKLINGETPSRDVRMRADSIVSSSSSSSTLKAPSSSESPRRLPLSGSCTVHCTRPQSSAPRRARPAR